MIILMMFAFSYIDITSTSIWLILECMLNVALSFPKGTTACFCIEFCESISETVWCFLHNDFKVIGERRRIFLPGLTVFVIDWSTRNSFKNCFSSFEKRFRFLGLNVSSLSSLLFKSLSVCIKTKDSLSLLSSITSTQVQSSAFVFWLSFWTYITFLFSVDVPETHDAIQEYILCQLSVKLLL